MIAATALSSSDQRALTSGHPARSRTAPAMLAGSGSGPPRRRTTQPLARGRGRRRRRRRRDRRDLPAQAARPGRLAERRLPAGGAARLRVLGAVARALATSLLSAAAFNFFHHPPGRPLHDRRQPQLGRARRIHHRRGRGQRRWPRSPAAARIEAERRRREADLAAALARELLAGSDTKRRARRRPRGDVAEALGDPVRVDRARRGRRPTTRRRALALQRRRRQPDRDAARPAGPSRPTTSERLRNARRAGARGARRDRAAPGRDAGRGGGDRGAAPQRRRQDRAAASGLARPAHAADRDRRRRPRAGDSVAERRGADRAERGRGRGGRAARAARRQAARPLEAPGRRRRAAARLGLARGRRCSPPARARADPAASCG